MEGATGRSVTSFERLGTLRGWGSTPPPSVLRGSCKVMDILYALYHTGPINTFHMMRTDDWLTFFFAIFVIMFVIYMGLIFRRLRQED